MQVQLANWLNISKLGVIHRNNSGICSKKYLWVHMSTGN